MRKKRGLPELNAGSMADIAFLLLIFFLVATQIAEEKGVHVTLPEYYDGPAGKAPDNNVLDIKINKFDELLVEGNNASIDELPDIVKNFVLNPNNDANLPSKPSKTIISIQNDMQTSYGLYVNIYSLIQNSYLEMRKELALQTYGNIQYDREMIRAINKKIPMIISEADPVEF